MILESDAPARGWIERGRAFQRSGVRFMAVTADQVRELRERTGAGMMECKKALLESQGDFDRAVEVFMHAYGAK